MSRRPILGRPACGMCSRPTTFDLVLQRLLAGEAIGNAENAALGHGGLLSREVVVPEAGEVQVVFELASRP